jgi:hypothetical protein
MVALNLQLCLIVRCRYCGTEIHYSLPLEASHTLKCACGTELAIDNETLDRVEALAARFRASVRGAYERETPPT